jgi:hypothetical protein
MLPRERPCKMRNTRIEGTTREKNTSYRKGMNKDRKDMKRNV